MEKTTDWKLQIFGGADRIGRENCMVLSHPHSPQVFMIDLGATHEATMEFADETWMHDSLLNKVMDFYRTLLREGRELILLVTHFHFDHVGRIPFLLHMIASEGLALPRVFAHRFTLACLENMIANNYKYAMMDGDGTLSPEMNQLQQKVLHFPRTSIDERGIAEFPMADIEAISVVHSVPWSQGFLFSLRQGKDVFKLFYTSDYKWIEVKKSHPEVIGADLVISDCTSINRLDTVGESVARTNIMYAHEHRTWAGPTFISMFSTNVERLHALIGMANKKKTKCFVTGKALVDMLRIYEAQPGIEKVEYKLAVDATDFNDLNSDSIIFLTGVWAQGYVTSTDFARMSYAEQQKARQMQSKLVKLAAGQSVLNVPGPTGYKGVFLRKGMGVILSGSIYDFVEHEVMLMVRDLIDVGVTVMLDDMSPTTSEPVLKGPIHSSGHAHRDAFERVIKDINPRMLAAYHCEANGRTSCNAFAMRNGYGILNLKDGAEYIINPTTKEVVMIESESAAA